eukprot:gene7518-5404_t
MHGTTVRPAPYGVSTILMALLFGTNFFLYVLFQMIKARAVKPSDQLVKKEKKELSKPFNGTLDCYTALTQELFLTGMIMAMTYVCEYCWLFAHSSKSYSRDLFMFVLIVFFAYAWYTIHPVKDLSLLGREQTEEWKGWMQFIFLLYHYFHAEEVYNSVRVMITCYVWMTGFGNFSFFYMKQDFGWLRMVQMLWRLNFSVILLMWTHQNTYILYYICPMHTFYFLMVYVTMYCFQSLNATKWGIRWKLLVLALIIYVVWDINYGLFDILFAWLGTDKVIGANSGSVYEYYFRTSLDHYSTFLGMIFALNYPLAEQYFTTLETYLLQHHIWLTSNAKTLWTIIPNHPWINFALATIVFFLVSKELYRLTMSLRGMILPDDKDIAWRNMWGGIGVVSVFGLIAYVLASFNPSVVQLVIACQGLAIALVFVIGRFTATLNEQQIFQQQSSRFLKLMSILFFSTLIAQFVWTSPEAAAAAQDSYALALAKYHGNAPACLSSISEGAWTTVPCPANPLPKGVSSLNSLAFCEQDLWSWAPHSDDCPIAKLTTARAASAFKDKDILFVGDSVVRSSYHQFISLLEPKYEQNHSFVFKHQDFSHVIRGSNVSVRFIWAPFVADIAKVFQTRLPMGGKPVSYIVAGASLWDALHDHDLAKFNASLTTVAAALPTAYQGVGANRTSTVKVWLLPTNILDDRLTTAEKRQYMNDDTIRTYRATAAKSTALQQAFHVLVDPTNATGRRESTSTDGVHYAEEVYSVIAQIIAAPSSQRLL